MTILSSFTTIFTISIRICMMYIKANTTFSIPTGVTTWIRYFTTCQRFHISQHQIRHSFRLLVSINTISCHCRKCCNKSYFHYFVLSSISILSMEKHTFCLFNPNPYLCLDLLSGWVMERTAHHAPTGRLPSVPLHSYLYFSFISLYTLLSVHPCLHP